MADDSARERSERGADDRNWKFELEDLDDDSTPDSGSDLDSDSDSELVSPSVSDTEPTGDAATESDSYGPEANSTPVQAGTPTLENSVFVALGAIAMVAVIIRLVSLGLGV